MIALKKLGLCQNAGFVDIYFTEKLLHLLFRDRRVFVLHESHIDT